MSNILIFIAFWIVWWALGIVLLKFGNKFASHFYSQIIKNGSDEENEILNKIL